VAGALPTEPTGSTASARVGHEEAVVAVDATVTTALGTLARSALIETCGPLIEACRGLARVGLRSLWAEVSDGAAATMVEHGGLPSTPDGEHAASAALDALLGVQRSPWPTRPRVVLGTAVAGTETPEPVAALAVRRGGCCLAYTAPAPEQDLDPDDPAAPLTPASRAYLRRFPAGADGPRYCSTCRFRSDDDSVERQVWWAACSRGTC
jgi:hypothetical protein